MTVSVEDLRLRVRMSNFSAEQADVMQRAFDAAHSYVVAHSEPELREANVIVFEEAVLVLAARLWDRRNSPAGVAGWGDIGAVRVASVDSDFNMLMGQLHLPGIAGAGRPVT